MKAVIVLIVLISAFAIFADSGDVVLHLRDSSVVTGTLIAVREKHVIIDNEAMGKVRIPRDKIVDSGLYRKRIEPYYFRDRHSRLAFIPSAVVPPRGTIDNTLYCFLYFANAISITNSTCLHINSFPPVMKNYRDIKIGLRQLVFRSGDSSFYTTVSGSMYMPDRYDQQNVKYFWNISALCSYFLDDRIGFHANVGYVVKRITGGLYYEESGILYKVSDNEFLRGVD